jgi:hypothetical protein
MAQPPNQLAKILPTAWDANSSTHYSKVVDAVNSLLGYNGPAVISNSLDVRGNNVQNVANPVSGTDAMNLQTAEAKYSPSVTSSQLDVTGGNALKGLTYLYRQSQKGLSVTITTAALTTGGAQGSMTFLNGLLVNSVQST